MDRLARARCGGSAPWAAARPRRRGGRSPRQPQRQRQRRRARGRRPRPTSLRRPSSSQVPSTSSPSGASRSRNDGPGAGDLALVVLAQHVERAHDRGGRPPAAAPRTRRAAKDGPPAPAAAPRATRAGSISIPTTSASARTRRSRSCSSTAVTGEAPYPRSTTTGAASAPPQPPRLGPASQRSTRRSRLGLVVPRVIVPTGRCTATRAAYAGRRRLGRAGVRWLRRTRSAGGETSAAAWSRWWPRSPPLPCSGSSRTAAGVAGARRRLRRRLAGAADQVDPGAKGWHPGWGCERLPLLGRAADQPRQRPAPADRDRGFDAVRGRGERDDRRCGSDRGTRHRRYDNVTIDRAGLPAGSGELLRHRPTTGNGRCPSTLRIESAGGVVRSVPR